MPDLERQDQVKHETLGTRGFIPRRHPHPGNNGQIGRRSLLASWIFTSWIVKAMRCYDKTTNLPCNLPRLFSAQVSPSRLNFQMWVLTLFLQDICLPASGSRYLSLWLCGLHEQSLVCTGKGILCTSDSPSYAVGTIPFQAEAYRLVLTNWARWWMGSREGNLQWDLAGVAARDGLAAWCSEAGPGMYITRQGHADPCLFGEESRENTTRNAATAALLTWPNLWWNGWLVEPRAFGFINDHAVVA